MNKTKTLSVYFTGSGNVKQKVGTLALYKEMLCAFEYDDSWIKTGFSISPFSLPLEKKVFIPEWEPFGGIYGVFNDSLPDGWGRLLVDRVLAKNHINAEELTALDRLAIVGSSGAGALVYEPEQNLEISNSILDDYDKLASECKNILNSKNSSDLDSLFLAGGSSGGTRPKVNVNMKNEKWIVKFPSTVDSDKIGVQEYKYFLCAKKCGIEMADCKLFHSEICDGYFGTKRFDCNPLPVHVVSASGLLETSHRIPNLDYNTLMLLTMKITNSFSELEKLYRLMCFNVFAHNRDDHSKNFSWLYNFEKKEWRFAPAYDLTYSNSIGGEHATTVDGEGKTPSFDNLLSVAKKSGLKESWAKETAMEISCIVNNMLGEWIKIERCK